MSRPQKALSFFAAEPLEFEPLCSGLLTGNDLRIVGRAFDRGDDLIEVDFDGSL